METNRFAALILTLFVLASLLLMSDAYRRGGNRGRVSAGENQPNGTGKGRRGKFLSVFQVVEFPNALCNGSDASIQGTCYTAQQCEERGGSNGGSCAEGWGVCCHFSIGCDETSNENVTVFESTGAEEGQGACVATICKVNDNICQLRLDFTSFSISGPSTVTESRSTEIATENPVNRRRSCLTDSFAVISPGAVTPPVICGNNKGEHMYVDMNSDCVQLAMNINGDDAEWQIKVSQYPCDFSNLAPTGCTQYYYGETEGSVQTYNFDGNDHLNGQNQKICIRREANNCRICYTIEEKDDFQLSGMKEDDGTAISGAQSQCCGQTDGNEGYDCLIIPSVSYYDSNDSILKRLSYSEFCGSKVTFSEFDNIGAKSVCSRRVPFEVSFMSDQLEVAEDEDREAGRSQNGFRLQYRQNSENC